MRPDTLIHITILKVVLSVTLVTAPPECRIAILLRCATLPTHPASHTTAAARLAARAAVTPVAHAPDSRVWPARAALTALTIGAQSSQQASQRPSLSYIAQHTTARTPRSPLRTRACATDSTQAPRASAARRAAAGSALRMSRSCTCEGMRIVSTRRACETIAHSVTAGIRNQAAAGSGTVTRIVLTCFGEARGHGLA